MNGELTVLPLMYTVTVASTGQLFAESNDSLISTLCMHSNWNWAFEAFNCNIIMQLDEVGVMQLAPLRSDFMEQSVRNKINNKFVINFLKKKFIELKVYESNCIEINN